MVFSIFDKAQSHMEQKLPFVLYKKPREFDVNGIFQKNAILHSVSDFSESGFVFAPFDNHMKPILMKADEVCTETFNIEKKSILKDSPTGEHTDSKIYEMMVLKAIDAIKENELKKVVLSRKKEVYVSVSAITIFQRLINTYENALCYVWYHPRIGTWLGATPEILLKSRGNAFVTMSLAGTQVVGKELDVPDWGQKEIYEQQLVTDFILEALGGKTTDLKIGNLETTMAGQLWHLRTKISGNFELGKLADLIKSLHPTPAVCGIPKEKAKTFILENEQYDRMFYTGYLGELNLRSGVERNTNPRNKENGVYRSILNSTELFVNLRCMKLDGPLATLFIGGGITSDSDPRKEWEETENKSKTILKVLTD